MSEKYSEQQNKLYTQKIRAILKDLPSCCSTFFRGIDSQTSVLTRYVYAIDLKLFFTFLVKEVSSFQGKNISELTLLDLDMIKAVDIELFLEHISLYLKQDREIVNHEQAKARKLSTLRSFFKYFFKREMMQNNMAALVDIPKIRERAIIRLEPNEVADLLDVVEAGAGLSAAQKRYHRFTKTRDLAMLTLFLGSGIRIGELVGIDIDDIDFLNNTFLITRKAGFEDIMAFSEEVRAALLSYMLQRETIEAAPGHETAFFLSIQKRRITARAIENLVKKYAAIAAPLKKISPHKLRSTYGTMLYQETGDIYLVADVLGHKDVNTTRKHYAALSEDRRRMAAKAIKLRESPNEESMKPAKLMEEEKLVDEDQSSSPSPSSS